MKITVESTGQIVRVNGVEARVWRGITERGIAIEALIPRIAVRQNADCSQFEAELKETPAPEIVSEAFPLRMLI